MRIPAIDRFHRSKSRSARRKRSRRQQSKRSFLSSLRLEPLEARRMLHGGIHDHVPEHSLEDHIHADLRIVIEGQQVAIPMDLGIDTNGAMEFVHTHDVDNRLHLQPFDTTGDGVPDPPDSFQTVGDFFDIWFRGAGFAEENPDAVFSATEILGNVADDQHAIRMFVNGFQVDTYESYQIHDEDDIVISYSSHPVVSLHTNQGTILMEMLTDDAPNTVANFLDYVNDGDYDNSFIHRSAKYEDGRDFIIQGGGFVTSSETFSSLLQFSEICPVDVCPTLDNEFGVLNTLGTVAMAKLGGYPNSATSQWFVNLSDNDILDIQNGGFTVFATVLDMQPVAVIAALRKIDADVGPGTYDTLPVEDTLSVEDPDNELKLVVIESVGGDGTVSGVAFEDTDGDGVRDGGESGVKDVLVFVDADSSGTLGMDELFVTTGADGSYQLRLPAGQHVIRQQVPIGETPTSPADPSQATTVLIGGATTNLDFGRGTAPAAPTVVDLLAVADTGSSDTDNITSKNNSSVVESLQFRVTGVQDGNVVNVFAGLQEIGQAVVVGGAAVVTTSGSQVLTDGSVDITATQSLGLLQSTASAALAITVDTAVEDFSSTPPTAAVIGEPLIYDVQNPEEGNAGFYSIDELPTGMTIHSASGVITWIPVAAQLGSQQVPVKATDAAGNTRLHNMTLEVTGEVLVNFRLAAVDSENIVLTEVTVGDDFTLQVFVQDLREVPEGVAAGYLDVVVENQLVSILAGEVAGPTTSSDSAVVLATLSDDPSTGETDYTKLLITSGNVDLDTAGANLVEPGDIVRYLFTTDASDNEIWTVFVVDSVLDDDSLIFTTAHDEAVAEQRVEIIRPITFAAPYVNAISGDPSPGLVDEGGGFAGFSVGDAPGAEKLLFSVPMRANLAGAELFTSNPADILPQNGTLFYGSDDAVNTAKIAYQSKSLTVNVGFTVVADVFNFDEDSQGVTLDVLRNDIPTPGGEALTISSVGTPDENGTVSIASDGLTLIYSPAANYFGPESITYTASDSTGDLQTTVVIGVHPQGDDPTATDDLLAVDANSQNVFLDLLQNDSIAPDVDEQLAIIAVTATTQNGLVTIGPGGTHVRYTPAANFNGVDTFSYTISDGTVSSGNDGQAVGNVTVQVGEIDNGTGPTANDDAFTFAEDSAMQTLGVLANDTLGTGGGSLVISTVTSPTQGGTVQLATDSLALLYTPAADFFGNELFTYTVGDGNGGVAVGQVTVTVTAENDPPLATSDTFDVVKNITAQVLDPLSNDSIAPDEGESLTITAVGTADQGGTVTIAGDGLSLLYTPATDFDAQETFTYTIGDGSGETAQATVTVNVLDYVPSTLAGSVYIDANNDGLQDAAEMVLAGVTVNLTGTDFGDQAVSQTLTTNSHGKYEFTDLAPGSYVISQVQPAYLIDGQERVGSQGGTENQNDQITIELAENTNGLNNDFGERGREASTFTLADFSVHTRETSLFGLFGEQPEEQWVALNSSWSEYKATDVTWYDNSHTLVIDVTDTQDVVNSAVLSWEAGHAVRQLGHELPAPLITLDNEPAAVDFTPASSESTGNEVVKVPDFSLPDVNETSSTHGQDISPRDYEGNVTAFYFGVATCSYCTAQFGHLDSLQDELDANHDELGIKIVGVNRADRESHNDVITEGRDLPWLQDVDDNEDGDSDAWMAWEAQLRDVVLLDRANQKISTYNLTQNDLGETDNYDHLKELLVGAATAEGETDVYYQQDQELEQAVSLIDRDQSSQTDDDYLEALDEVLEMWW